MVTEFKQGDTLRVVSFWTNREYAPHLRVVGALVTFGDDVSYEVRRFDVVDERGSRYRFSKREYFELADGPW